jgi:hypothetical protein
LALLLIVSLAGAGCLHKPLVVIRAPENLPCLETIAPESDTTIQVTWHRPSPESERRALAARCAAVGPSVVVAGPGPESQALSP